MFVQDVGKNPARKASLVDCCISPGRGRYPGDGLESAVQMNII